LEESNVTKLEDTNYKDNGRLSPTFFKTLFTNSHFNFFNSIHRSTMSNFDTLVSVIALGFDPILGILFYMCFHKSLPKREKHNQIPFISLIHLFLLNICMSKQTHLLFFLQKKNPFALFFILFLCFTNNFFYLYQMVMPTMDLTW